MAEIEPALGREVEAIAGFIDNLFLSPHGYLTIAGTELWCNPEACRQVEYYNYCCYHEGLGKATPYDVYNRTKSRNTTAWKGGEEQDIRNQKGL